MPRLWVLFTALLLAVSVVGCAHGNKKAEKPENPNIMLDGHSVALNTFTLDQSAFPILTGTAALDGPPEYAILDDAAARELIGRLFAEAGFPLQPDHRFNYGKIHVKLDGYNSELCVGYMFVSMADFELPKLKSDRSPDVRSLFYTVKDPDRISGPELLLFEQLNQQEQTYVAIINAHQFAWPVADGEAGRQRMLAQLSARVKLYLRWLQARIEARRKAAQNEP